jgi:hypothetical protein
VTFSILLSRILKWGPLFPQKESANREIELLIVIVDHLPKFCGLGAIVI